VPEWRCAVLDTDLNRDATARNGGKRYQQSKRAMPSSPLIDGGSRGAITEQGMRVLQHLSEVFSFPLHATGRTLCGGDISNVTPRLLLLILRPLATV
jgi:hypothetical protein